MPVDDVSQSASASRRMIELADHMLELAGEERWGEAVALDVARAQALQEALEQQPTEADLQRAMALNNELLNAARERRDAICGELRHLRGGRSALGAYAANAPHMT